MTKSLLNRLTGLVVSVAIAATMTNALVPQVSGGASAFQGQDIMGGAAIVFKRPQRVRDIVGGAAMLVVKRSPPKLPRPVEVAHADRRRPRPTPTEPALTNEDKGEAF